MVLVIEVDARDVLFYEDGQMIVKLNRYAAFARGGSMVAVETDNADAARAMLASWGKSKGVKRRKSFFVGVNGGISLE